MLKLLGRFARRMSRPRTPHYQPQARFLPHLERLEDRTVPVANIKSTLVNGLLTLTAVDTTNPNAIQAGDNLNDLVIFRTAGNTYEVYANSFRDGRVDGLPFKVFTGVNDIRIILGQGDDAVNVINAQLNSLTVSGDNGNDSLLLTDHDDAFGTGDVTADGSNHITNVTFNGGATTNTIFGPGTNSFLVEGAAEWLPGSLRTQNAEVTIGSLGTSTDDIILGQVTITNAPSIFVAGASVHILANLNITNGTGNHFISLAPSNLLEVFGNVTIKNGTGFDDLRLGTVTGGSTVNLHNSIAVNNGAGGSQTLLNENIIIGGTLTVTNAAGADTFAAQGTTPTASVSVLNDVTIKNGDGNTLTVFATPNLNLTGALSVTNGIGQDTFKIDDAVTPPGPVNAILHNVTINNGSGGSRTELVTSAFPGSLLTGNLKVTATGGTDDVLIQGLNITAAVTLSLGGGGPSHIDLLDAVIQGAFTSTILDHDTTITIDRTTIGGLAKITTGIGNDTINISDSSLQAVTLNTGAGNDTVNIERDGDSAGSLTKTTFGGALSILLGTGSDNLFVGGDADNFAQFNGIPIAFNGGGGTDTLTRGLNGFAFPANQPVKTSIEVDQTV